MPTSTFRRCLLDRLQICIVSAGSPHAPCGPAAIANGLAALVPTEEAQIYNRLDFEATECIRVNGEAGIENSRQRAPMVRLGVKFLSGEHLHLTSAQLDDFLKAVTENQEMALWEQLRLAFWKGASDALPHHVSTMDEMFPYMFKEGSSVPKL